MLILRPQWAKPKDLIKKGLRPFIVPSMSGENAKPKDLIKKGLRHKGRLLYCNSGCQTQRPD